MEKIILGFVIFFSSSSCSYVSGARILPPAPPLRCNPSACAVVAHPPPPSPPLPPSPSSPPPPSPPLPVPLSPPPHKHKHSKAPLNNKIVWGFFLAVLAALFTFLCPYNLVIGRRSVEATTSPTATRTPTSTAIPTPTPTPTDQTAAGTSTAADPAITTTPTIQPAAGTSTAVQKAPSRTRSRWYVKITH